MNKLEGLKPERVFHYFEEISQIPRCSFHEEKISNHLKGLGEKLGFETIQDDNMNIIIRKNGSQGYEDSPGVIIQGHMDMVCEKEDNSEHDFENDPIDLIVEDGFIKANETTLGADNGIAIAIGLAILEDDNLDHPPLELLITTTEETSMEGALKLSDTILKGRRLLNIDSEEEGILTVGSAGGELVELEIPLESEEGSGYKKIIIEVSGLMGGHSGMEIDKERLNSHKVLTDLLLDLKDKGDFKLISFKGGSKDNAIPRKTIAEIAVKKEEKEDLLKNLDSIKASIIDKNRKKEEGIEIRIKKEGEISRFIKEDKMNSFLQTLKSIPTGVYTWLSDDRDVVESSSNLAIINLQENKFTVQISTRSSSKEQLLDIRNKIIGVVDENGGNYKVGNEYPEWEYKEDSPLREKAMKVYKDLFNKDAEVTVIHAGLECGVFTEKYPDMDVISIGPNIYNAHTPQEKLEIQSVERTFQYIQVLLKELNK